VRFVAPEVHVGIEFMPTDAIVVSVEWLAKHGWAINFPHSRRAEGATFFCSQRFTEVVGEGPRGQRVRWAYAVCPHDGTTATTVLP
jgi:hypothetical protein